MSKLPTDTKERKSLPLGTGVLDYFPKALAEVAKASVAGNKKYLPGQPLHWDRTQSTDQSDAIIRHYVDRYEMDTDGVLHAGHMAWRCLAFLEELIETREQNKNELKDLDFS